MTVNCLLRKEFDPRILPVKRPALSKAELEARRRRGRTPEQVEKERAFNRAYMVAKRARRLSEARKERVWSKSPTALEADH